MGAQRRNAVRCAWHARGVGLSLWATAGNDALDICNEIDPDQTGSLGAAIDVYHCWWDRHLPSHSERAGRERRIDAFHVSDWLTTTQDMLLDRGMMGDGVINLQGIRADVEAAGHTGAAEVEIFSKNDWWQRDAQEALQVCADRLQTFVEIRIER